jgi:hypothetical protein
MPDPTLSPPVAMQDPTPTAALHPLALFQQLLAGSARRLTALTNACAQDPLSPPQVELALIRLTHEAMRALLAQTQLQEQAARVPLTNGLQTAIAELTAHTQRILAQIQMLEGQRQIEQLTVPQRQVAQARATAAQTRLLQTLGQLEARRARQAAREKLGMVEGPPADHWAASTPGPAGEHLLAATNGHDAPPPRNTTPPEHEHLLSVADTLARLGVRSRLDFLFDTTAVAGNETRTILDLPGTRTKSPEPGTSDKQSKKRQQKKSRRRR